MIEGVDFPCLASLYIPATSNASPAGLKMCSLILAQQGKGTVMLKQLQQETHMDSVHKEKTAVIPQRTVPNPLSFLFQLPGSPPSIIHLIRSRHIP